MVKLKGELLELERSGLYNELQSRLQNIFKGPSVLSLYRAAGGDENGDNCIAAMFLEHGVAKGTISKDGFVGYAHLSHPGEEIVGLSVSTHGMGGDIVMNSCELFEGCPIVVEFGAYRGGKQ